MNLTQLKAIVLIDYYHSLSRAAVDLFISQASLSMSIKKLEDELGCEIIKRTSHGASLTSRGKEILEHAKAVCGAVDAIYRIGRKESSRSVVDASIGVSSYLCNLIATRAMLKLRSRHNDINVKINDISNNNHNIMEIYIGAYDLALLQTGRVEDRRLSPVILDKYKIKARHLFSDTVCVAVADSHPLSAQESCSLSQLKNFPYITNKNPAEDAFYIYLKEMGYVRDIIQVNHVLNYEIGRETGGFWAAARQGLLAMKSDMRKSIHILKIDFCNFYYDIASICKNSSMSETLGEYIALLEEEARNLRDGG